MATLFLSTQARPIFMTQETISKNSLSSINFDEVATAFFKGFKIEEYTNFTDECLTDTLTFSQHVQDGLNNFDKKDVFIGILNITDALGTLSPLSRDCFTSFDQLNNIFKHWKKQFKDTQDFFNKISVNVMYNFKYIKEDLGMILSKYMTGAEAAEISFLVGEIISYTFVIEGSDPFMASPVSPLKYMDPLAASPVSEIVWTVFEGGFKFLLNSHIASSNSILDCQEGTVNMALFSAKAQEFHKKNNFKDSLFTFSDGMAYAHEVVEGCVATGKEIDHTVKQINLKNIVKNFKKNAATATSALTTTWAEIYYKDWISLLGALGDLTYRIVIDGIE